MEGTGRYGRGTTLLLALRLAPEIGAHRRRLATRRHFIGVNRHALLVFQAGRSRASSGSYCHRIHTNRRLSQARYPYYSRS